MKVVFHGTGTRAFREGLEALLIEDHQVVNLPDGTPSTAADREHYVTAQVIVGGVLTPEMPRPDAVRLFQSPGAGYDRIDLSLLPATAALCNCFGHERAIAEYVMAAILMHHVPFVEADRNLRKGIWEYGGTSPSRLRREAGSTSIGILGYGHIGKAIAPLARAFGMPVTALSRRPLDDAPEVSEAFLPGDLHRFMQSADAIVLAAPLTAETRGMIDAAALGAMRKDALLINVARGPLVDEQALFDALRSRQIGGAVIDTWYLYKDLSQATRMPSNLPFHELDNIVMTPHMSGWSRELIARRRQTIADNINALASGRPLLNVVRSGGPAG